MPFKKAILPQLRKIVLKTHVRQVDSVHYARFNLWLFTEIENFSKDLPMGTSLPEPLQKISLFLLEPFI
jgi:hypothetical protein